MASYCHFALQDAARKLSAYAGDWREPLRSRWLGTAGALCAVFLMTAMEPWKTWQGYNRQINTDSSFGFWYVADHKRPGDIVLANTPDAAATVTHGLDYYLSGIIFFDALYQRGNESWNAGLAVISSAISICFAMCCLRTIAYGW